MTRTHLIVDNNARFYILSRYTDNGQGSESATLKASESIQEIADYIELNHPGETVIFRITPKPQTT